MEVNNAINKFINECEIFYNEENLSTQTVLVDYLKFMSEQYSSEEKNISFALHTGSLCFDIIVIVTSVISSLAYNKNSNEDIISGLAINDMVVYKNERYKWKGIEDYNGNQMMVLEKENKKYGNSQKYVPFEKFKHMVSIYNGTSHTTDGRGIRKKKTDREDFFSFLYDVPKSEIPSAIDASFAVVLEKDKSEEIVKNVTIHYDRGKVVNLLDLVAASYYTGNGEEIVIGKNPTKKEPVLKFTSKISSARDIVLDKSGNKTIGLLVMSSSKVSFINSEFQDLLNRKSLKYVHYMSNYDLDLGENIVRDYPESSIFACTPSYLKTLVLTDAENKMLGKTLIRQIDNLINLDIEERVIKSEITIKDANLFKKSIIAIKNSNIDENIKSQFIINAYALFNLFITAPFKLQLLENLIIEEKLHRGVMLPQDRIDKLKELSIQMTRYQSEAELIVNLLTQEYKHIYRENRKSRELESIIREYKNKKILIVVPKAYYIDVLLKSNVFGTRLSNVKYTSVNKFDRNSFYDVIITIGDLHSENFGFFECVSSPKIYILNSEFESNYFFTKRKKATVYEKNIYNKHKEKNFIIDEQVERNELYSDEDTYANMLENDEIDKYIESINYIAPNILASFNSYSDGRGGCSEVSFIGKFSTGESILFSKYYIAVVYDVEQKSVVEKNVDKIEVGDVVVFTKNDNNTKNIVDIIFEELLMQNKISEDGKRAYEKSNFWKRRLREYKDYNCYTYREIAERMSKYGSKYNEQTIRQWIIPESHIVGPRKIESLKDIAELLNDTQLKNNIEEYYNSFKIVRTQRRKILTLIERAINSKLAGTTRDNDEILNIVYNNIDKLSETFEVDKIQKLEETLNIPVNLVNKPLTREEIRV